MTAGYFGSTSRFKYTRSSLETPTPEQPKSFVTETNLKRDTGHQISERIQHVLRNFTGTQQSAIKHAGVTGMQKPPMKRAAIAGTQPPMKRAAVAGTQPPVNNSAFTDMLHQKKRHHEEGPCGNSNSLPPRPPPCPPNRFGSEMPKRQKLPMELEWTAGYRHDPLLHRSVVTPPCPIRPGLNETPRTLRSYTHVSTKKS